MLAYARAGSTQLDPQPLEQETFDRDPCDYVDIPLNVVLKYHQRLQTTASLLAPDKALSFILHKDEEERQVWVETHRNSTQSLGRIIAATMDKREALWAVPRSQEHVRPPLSRSRPAASSASAPARASAPPRKQSPGSKPLTSDKLKDGKEICKKYNLGQCSEPCPAGRLHVCNAVVAQSGRICGMKNHKSIDCKSALKQ
eukprot:1394496-Amphidinium_carterae.1